MRLSHVLQAVYARPWCITQGGWNIVHNLVRSKLAGDVVTKRAENDGLDLFGEEIPTTEDIGPIRVIPIRGIIGHRVGLLEKSCGVTDLLDLRSQLTAAVNDASVRAILLEIDSPGGVVTGVPETASMIREIAEDRPLFAFTDGQMCSAAYWLGSQADAVFATQTADVGSIGVYMAILDESIAYALQGFSVDVFKAGRQKAAGLPGTSLSDEQKAHFQSEIDQIYGWFTSAVSAKRKETPSEAMQGQSFLAHAASEKGVRLIDQVMADRTAVLTWITNKLN